MRSHSLTWRAVWIAVAWAWASGAAMAQWLTQTNNLKAGWNAVYLHVDASHAPISQIMAAAPDIEEVWLWNPLVLGQQFVESPQVPSSSGSRWTRWTKNLGDSSPLKLLAPNAAYYVKVKDTTATYAWLLKGRPVPPAYGWTTTGLNFVGFPLAQQLSYEQFFLPAPELLQGTEVYASPGGAFGAGNPIRIYDFTRNVLQRGEAVWMRVDGGFNRFFGSFEISGVNQRGLDFGTESTQLSFRIRNTSDQTNVVRMEWIRSELPPAGQPSIPSMPPLMVRGNIQQGTTLQYDGIAMVETDPLIASTSGGSSSMEWTLPPAGQPGADYQVVLGVARSQITAKPGTILAGILRLTDGDSRIRVDLPVSVTTQSGVGLWVGDAQVTQVTQYLKQFAVSGDGSRAIGRRWTTTSVDTFFGGDQDEGLDLSGTFAYAVNLGTTSSTSQTTRDAVFQRASSTTGLALSSGGTIINLATFSPTMVFGTSSADDSLENVLRSAAYVTNGTLTATLNVEQGVRYKLQLLFAERDVTEAPWSGFNVLVGDNVIVPNLIPSKYITWGGTFASQKTNVGVVVSHEFTASTNKLVVTLDSAGATATDIKLKMAFLNGLTLERIDASNLPPELKATEGSYLLEGTTEKNVGVPKAFPLRLIVHDDGTNAFLLQHVFIGDDLATNTIVATRQSMLAPARLAGARRITAAHLPWSQANAPWPFATGGTNGTSMLVTVSTPYDSAGANPFVHQYHPDHDNLNAAFSSTLPKGQESYGITRTIRLTPATVGSDFESQTVGHKRRVGIYEETVTLEGSGANVRTFRSAGSYSLTRISTVPTLTK